MRNPSKDFRDLFYQSGFGRSSGFQPPVEQIVAPCGNTITAPIYLEEGYLPQWNRYMQWLSATIARPFLLLELGVDLSTPTVIRYPFEKTVLVNEKARLVRVNEKDYQIPEQIKSQSTAIMSNSVDLVACFGGESVEKSL